MPEVISVTFREAGMIYYFDPADVECETGDWVVVDTARGSAIAKVMAPRMEVGEKEVERSLKSVRRKATGEELEKYRELKEQERDVLARCSELVSRHELPMKLVAAEYDFDGSHLTIYFTAEGKVDFRALLKEMGSTFKTRVELRQIGARDAAKLLGGIGKCGRVLCCTSFLNKFVPISVRMARDQSLPLNPTTISGDCGKLLCCLKYEHDQYLAMRHEHPAPGTRVSTPQGEGSVVEVNHLKETALVHLESDAFVEMSVPELTPLHTRQRKQ